MYSKDIDPKCALCQKSSPMPGTTDMVCEIHGVVAYNYSCKRYKYDIFKKKIHPKRRADNSFSAEDFAID